MTPEEKTLLAFNANIFPYRGYKHNYLELLSVREVLARNGPGMPLLHETLKRTLPRYYLVTRYEVQTLAEATLDRVLDPSFPLGQVAVLDRAPTPPFPYDAPPATRKEVRTVRFDAEHIDLETDCDRPSILVLAENYYPGWQASVDGKPVEIYRAFWTLRALELPAGQHEVRMWYSPFSFHAGCVAGLLGLICAFTLWTRERPVRRQNANGTELQSPVP